jgi:lipopolysaccharide transport system ATP-binding protein
MSKPIIEVEHLSKCYRIGAMKEPYLSIREELAKKTRRISSAFFHAFRNARPGPSNSETNFWALDDVSFSVQEGEAVGIIGRNGAGKSTLLKILSQITPPTKGRITMRGRVASLLEVGTGFHPELTGRENIFLNGAILGMRREEIRRKFNEIVAFAEVDKFLDTPVKRYSSGMYVRLAFAVAAHLEPEILIVDEVLAVGDAQFQKKCLGKMGEISLSGRTVLFVSHNMDAILRLCNFVYLLDKGHIIHFPSPADGVKCYLEQGLKEELLPIHKKPRFQVSDRLPIIVGFRIEGGIDGRPLIKTGGSLLFSIELKDYEDLSRVECAIAITDQHGKRIAIFHTVYHSNLIIMGAKFGIIKCYVPSLPLVPGTYLVDVIVGNGYQTVERLERVAKIEVIFDDIFHTGKLPGKNQGCVVFPCHWEEKAETSA